MTEKALTYFLLASLAKRGKMVHFFGKARKNEPLFLLFARAKRVRKGGKRLLTFWSYTEKLF